jgi:hypothetical protein
MPERAPEATSSGPYDADDPDAPVDDDALDLGALRIRVPAGARPLLTSGAGEAPCAVHLQVPSGQVSLSVLAAPSSGPLWPEMAEALAGAQGDESAVCSESGEWGPEVQTGSNGELTWFIGVDGPRWMLYGVATGPAERSAELVATLRALIRGSVVDRGGADRGEPLPTRTALPLTVPEGLAESSVVVDEPRQPSLPPEQPRPPAPVLARWHPSYHGTAPPKPTGDPGPAHRPEALPLGAAAPEPRRPGGAWPEWLDNPLAPERDGAQHAHPLSAHPLSRALGTRRRMRTGLIATSATLVLLLGATGVLMITHGATGSKAVALPEPSTALNTTGAAPTTSTPGAAGPAPAGGPAIAFGALANPARTAPRVNRAGHPSHRPVGASAPAHRPSGTGGPARQAPHHTAPDRANHPTDDSDDRSPRRRHRAHRDTHRDDDRPGRDTRAATDDDRPRLLNDLDNALGLALDGLG